MSISIVNKILIISNFTSKSLVWVSTYWNNNNANFHTRIWINIMDSLGQPSKSCINPWPRSLPPPNHCRHSGNYMCRTRACGPEQAPGSQPSLKLLRAAQGCPGWSCYLLLSRVQHEAVGLGQGTADPVWLEYDVMGARPSAPSSHRVSSPGSPWQTLGVWVWDRLLKIDTLLRLVYP